MSQYSFITVMRKRRNHAPINKEAVIGQATGITSVERTDCKKRIENFHQSFKKLYPLREIVYANEMNGRKLGKCRRGIQMAQ
jgi:hypothetical protein